MTDRTQPNENPPDAAALGRRAPSIVSPFLDGAMVGGLSIAGLALGLGYAFLLGGEFGRF